MAPEPIREELERILSSAAFARAERPSRFLRHLVDNALAGRGEQLKESVLGVEVFGRQPGYDARLDAVVRVEASKLRTRLEVYYSTEGSGNPVRIVLPRGGYAPIFTLPTIPGAAPGFCRLRLTAVAGTLAIATALGWFGMSHANPRAASPSLAVLPFEVLGSAPEGEIAARTLWWELTHRLSGVAGLRVVSQTSSRSVQALRKDAREIGRQLNASWLLEGGVRAEQNGYRVEIQLVDTATGICKWSKSFVSPAIDGQIIGEISAAVKNNLL